MKRPTKREMLKRMTELDEQNMKLLSRICDLEKYARDNTKIINEMAEKIKGAEGVTRW